MKLLILLLFFVLLFSFGVFASSYVSVSVDEVEVGSVVNVSLVPEGRGFYRNVYLCKVGGEGYRYPCGSGNFYTNIYSRASYSWRISSSKNVEFKIPLGLMEDDYFFAVYDYSSRSYVHSNSFKISPLKFPTIVTCSKKKSFFHWGSCNPSYCAIRGMESDPSRNCRSVSYSWGRRSRRRRISYAIEYCVNSFVSECEVGASCPLSFWNRYSLVSVDACSENRDSDLGNRKHVAGLTTGLDETGVFVTHEDFCINSTHVMEGVITDCVVELVPVECPVSCDVDKGACSTLVQFSWPSSKGSEVVECD